MEKQLMMESGRKLYHLMVMEIESLLELETNDWEWYTKWRCSRWPCPYISTMDTNMSLGLESIRTRYRRGCY